MRKPKKGKRTLVLRLVIETDEEVNYQGSVSDAHVVSRVGCCLHNYLRLPAGKATLWHSEISIISSNTAQGYKDERA